MYNEDRKREFLKERQASTVYLESIFNTAGKYEREAGKDLCELPQETLQTMLNRDYGKRKRTVHVALSYFRSYVSWCKEQGYPTSDGIYNIELQMDEKTRRFMVASPKHLQTILDKVFSPVEEVTVDCVYRCYLWMLFAGMKEADALEVKVGEVNLSSMLIEHGGKTYELYREAAPAFHVACEAKEFRYKHPKYEMIRARFPGEYLMRGIRSEKIVLETINKTLKKKFKSNGMELTQGSIRLSGVFYRTYEMERISGVANFDGEVEEHLANIERAQHDPGVRRRLAYQIRKDLNDDYACWKDAFT